jgi:hypothetical protein
MKNFNLTVAQFSLPRILYLSLSFRILWLRDNHPSDPSCTFERERLFSEFYASLFLMLRQV